MVVEIHAQPHFHGGFVSTSVTVTYGFISGVIFGYIFPLFIGSNKTYWRNALLLRILSALSWGALGAYLALIEEVSIAANSGLAYMCALGVFSFISLFRDDYVALGSHELTLRIFLGAWLPALCGGLLGALYNELLHGAYVSHGVLKTTLSLSMSSVLTFIFMAIIQLWDHYVNQRQLFGNNR